MAYDRFLIAPYQNGLRKDLTTWLLYKEVFWDIIHTTKGLFMYYKQRKDLIDMTGKKFGRLTVLSYCTNKKRRSGIWNCKCDCGKLCTARGAHLRLGTRKSCGCIQYDNLEQSGINFLILSYRNKASSRKIKFLLSMEEFAKLVKGNCFYCGREPFQKIHLQKSKKISIIYTGIDRKDTNGDYTIENCVSCCKICNVMKGTKSVEEFKNHIKRIGKWLMIGF